MYFKSLWVNRVRALSEVSLEPGPGLNILEGPNASGKTSLLEAIWLLIRVQSFLTPRIQEVIQHRQEQLEVSARVATCHSGEVRSRLEKGYNHTRIRYNGEDLKTASDQAFRFPAHVWTPDSHSLLSGSPRGRRRWLDWGTFHVEQAFLPTWRDYCLAMRHRNMLLRSGGSGAEFTPWEESMQQKGERIDRWRRAYLDRLVSVLPQACQEFGLDAPVRMSMNSGWDPDRSLAEILSQRREADRELGYTFNGPHRADVEFRSVEGVEVSRHLSRGQQKQLLLALAMARCQAEGRAERPVLLIDDLPAELDREHLRLALRSLHSASFQVFVSSVDHIDFKGISDISTFHVEQGRIRRAESGGQAVT